MTKNLSVVDLKNILNYYNVTIPCTIYEIKRKANQTVVKHMCNSNCDFEEKYKHLIYLFNTRRMISNQKKTKTFQERTRKNRSFPLNSTRSTPWIHSFEA
jgi:hypothetical protein